MQRFFEPVIQPLLDAVRPERIVEIGIADGGHSRKLAAWCEANGAHLDLVDPAPRFDTDAFLAHVGGVAHLHVGRSLDVLPGLPRPDVACIDGDHNWYTVYHELRALFDGDARPICVLHDTGWPYGRRDLYYEPGDIPEAYRQEWQRAPLVPDDPGLAAAGLNWQCCHAVREGGPRNGVQTAIDDLLAERPGAFRLVHLPVLHGLTLIVPVERVLPGSGLEALLDSLEPSEPWRALLSRAEAERCEGLVAAHRLAPLPRALGLPYAGPVNGRPFSLGLPPEVLARIQDGTMRSRYRDRAFLKNPFDQALYLRLLDRLRPRTVLEIGMAEGGSALWFADMMTVFGLGGRVVTVDRRPRLAMDDPRVDVFTGEAADLAATLPEDLLGGLPRPWLVIEDSAHTFEVSLAVLRFFDPWLAPGDYIVIEDGMVRALPGEQYLAYEDGPSRAIAAFLAERGTDYDIDTETCDFYGYNVTYAPNGWLRRREPAASPHG